MIFVPLLSEIIEGVTEKENLLERGELNDKAAGVFNVAYAIGCMTGPILGGYLKMWFGFRVTCDIFALGSAFYGILYFLIAVLPGLCKKKDRQALQVTVEYTPRTTLGKPSEIVKKRLLVADNQNE